MNHHNSKTRNMFVHIFGHVPSHSLNHRIYIESDVIYDHVYMFIINIIIIIPSFIFVIICLSQNYNLNYNEDKVNVFKCRDPITLWQSDDGGSNNTSVTKKACQNDLRSCHSQDICILNGIIRSKKKTPCSNFGLKWLKSLNKYGSNYFNPTKIWFHIFQPISIDHIHSIQCFPFKLPVLFLPLRISGILLGVTVRVA